MKPTTKYPQGEYQMLRGTQLQTGAQAAQYTQLINKIRDCLHPG